MSFVFNRWVRGNDFYGRTIMLNMVRERDNRSTWILGNRRVGKTSMLRQIEWFCRQGEWPSTVALYWDLQGSGTMEGLKESFIEALEDADELAEELGLDIDELESASFNEVMRKFRRAVKSLDKTHFLLLVDECEELVEVSQNDPVVLSAFRKLNHTEGFRLIMAGSMRLMDLDESNSRTSPFLPDFLPPLMLGPFEQNECCALLKANQISDEDATEIYRLTLGNPHLVQVLGDHFQRAGSFEKALLDLERDQICHYFFKSNFLCLPEVMRDWLDKGQAISRLGAMKPGDANLPFAVQSSLVAILPQEGLRISPLLEMVAGEKSTAPIPSSGTAPVNRQVVEKAPQIKVKAMPFEFLRARTSYLVCLPSECLTTDRPELIREAQNPPSLSMISAMDESSGKLHEILNGASPEYVLGQEADERTAVYLAGLFLYHRFLKGSPFDQVIDPWERAGLIGDRDVPLSPDLVRNSNLPSRWAMVLVRALAADPNHRYPTLAMMEQDLT